MANSWKYLENQFNVSTKNNFKKAVKISIYHDAQLNTQKVIKPALVPIYNRYHPLHETLNTAYDQWKSAGGSQEGQTLNMTQLTGCCGR